MNLIHFVFNWKFDPSVHFLVPFLYFISFPRVFCTICEVILSIRVNFKV